MCGGGSVDGSEGGVSQLDLRESGLLSAKKIFGGVGRKVGSLTHGGWETAASSQHGRLVLSAARVCCVLCVVCAGWCI